MEVKYGLEIHLIKIDIKINSLKVLNYVMKL